MEPRVGAPLNDFYHRTAAPVPRILHDRKRNGLACSPLFSTRLPGRSALEGHLGVPDGGPVEEPLVAMIELLGENDQDCRGHRSQPAHHRSDTARTLLHHDPATARCAACYATAIIAVRDISNGTTPPGHCVLGVRERECRLPHTQYLEEADRIADRIAVLDNGKLVAEWTPAELRGTAHTAHGRHRPC
jgi:hypothetical protein